MIKKIKLLEEQEGIKQKIKNMEFKAPQLVCVYGTLKEGFGNHRLLRDSEKLGEFKTNPVFTMLHLGGFPGIIEKGETEITCEIYKVVDDNILTSLDRLEGYPTFYNRKTIDTPWGEAWIYYLDDSEYNYNRGIVESGCWTKSY